MSKSAIVKALIVSRVFSQARAGVSFRGGGKDQDLKCDSSRRRCRHESHSRTGEERGTPTSRQLSGR